jgi:PAS domain-containing protein
MMSASIVIHDTLIIVRVNAEALELFRARPDQMIGAQLIALVDVVDFRGLASLRMQIARERENARLPHVEYVFRRFDGTRFFGGVDTHRLEDATDEWESQIRFISEH